MINENYPQIDLSQWQQVMEAYFKGPMGLTEDDIRILRERYLNNE